MTTARSLAILFERIAQGKAVSRAASRQMVAILLGQTHNDGIPAGLPSETRIAHKTGSFTGTNHDSGIVYPPHRKPYVLVILTTGIQDEKRANRLIAEISSHFVRRRSRSRCLIRIQPTPKWKLGGRLFQ